MLITCNTFVKEFFNINTKKHKKYRGVRPKGAKKQKVNTQACKITIIDLSSSDFNVRFAICEKTLKLLSKLYLKQFKDVD